MSETERDREEKQIKTKRNRREIVWAKIWEWMKEKIKAIERRKIKKQSEKREWYTNLEALTYIVLSNLFKACNELSSLDKIMITAA